MLRIDILFIYPKEEKLKETKNSLTVEGATKKGANAAKYQQKKTITLTEPILLLHGTCHCRKTVRYESEPFALFCQVVDGITTIQFAFERKLRRRIARRL